MSHGPSATGGAALKAAPAHHEPHEPVFVGKTLERIQELMTRYPTKQACLLPALWMLQEARGWVSEGGIAEVAHVLDLTPAYVKGVVTFYTMYHQHPVGKYFIQVCTTTPCGVCGAEDVAKEFLKQTGCGELGVTSNDGKYTVIEVECLGACGFATPVMVNSDFLESVTPSSVADVLEVFVVAPRLLVSRLRPLMGFPHKPHPKETQVLSTHFGDADARSLEGWKKRGGYKALEQALGMDPVAIQNVVKESGLRGRGGAGFPTGLKWSFMKLGDGKPHYLCCNADESEPGTFKDREIMRWTPHSLIEGCAIGAYAIGAETAYIYIRGEFTEPLERMERAVAEARAAGVIGKNAMGTGKTVDVWVHKGAGAYICGEETALMNSLEGKRGNPRIKPPFPAVAGLFGMPTTINNVETLTAVPHILNNGGEWYKKMARADNPKSTGTKLWSVCGNIARPGNYEVQMGFPFGEFLQDICGGAPNGRKIKAVIPGGSSVPLITWEEAESAFMDYEGMVAAGTMLGSAGCIVIDDAQSIPKVVARLARFYAHESCAQCTQCREGTAWTTKILERIVAGDGTMEDFDTLMSIADNMTGKTICVLSDSCATPVTSALQRWRPEFEALITKKTVHAVPVVVA